MVSLSALKSIIVSLINTSLLRPSPTVRLSVNNDAIYLLEIEEIFLVVCFIFLGLLDVFLTFSLASIFSPERKKKQNMKK